MPEMPTAEYVEARLASLRLSYPEWTIGPGPFGGFRAEHKSANGQTIRYLGGTTVADLAGRLLRITAMDEEVKEA